VSPPPSATAIVERRTVSSPLAGLISDPQAELARLRKRKAKAEQDLQREQGKLANPNFVANARPEVVAEVHERIAEFTRQIAQWDEQETLVSRL
jgi:valyl-tRNA synthetase